MAIAEPLDAVLDRMGELRAGPRMSSDAVFAEPFMRDHTRFDSFAAFCEQSPWSLADPEQIRTVDRDALDEYVAETTEFDTWEEMATLAAEEELVDQLLA